MERNELEKIICEFMTEEQRNATREREHIFRMGMRAAKCTSSIEHKTHIEDLVTESFQGKSFFPHCEDFDDLMEIISLEKQITSFDICGLKAGLITKDFIETLLEKHPELNCIWDFDLMTFKKIMQELHVPEKLWEQMKGIHSNELCIQNVRKFISLQQKLIADF